MLKETYLAKMKQTSKENPDAAFIVVTRSAGHVLSPSWKLLNDYKNGHIDWAQYTERFRSEMDCDSCISEMKRIWDMSQTRDVYLVCYEKPGENCHRYILMELLMSYSENCIINS
jgi:uncharacterized protein YeaO (DUF488 family)